MSDLDGAGTPPPLPGPPAAHDPVAAGSPPPLAVPTPPPPPAAAGTGVDQGDIPKLRATLHRTEETRTYPCETCGGDLEFHIGRQLLVCPHCGNEQQIVENTGRTVEERDFRRTVATLRAEAANRSVNQVAGQKEVACQSCGGHTTFTGSLTATRCPYCATPIQRDDVYDAPARLAVDGVVPFAVDGRSARDCIDGWIKSRWFAPNEFKKYNRKGSFTSIYMAYFTYDADATTDYEGSRGDNYTVTVGSGEDQRTETRTRWTPAAGRVHNSFDDVAVCANEGLDRRHVTALEPWPTETARPFSAEYVAGHLCRTYDHDMEACFGEAQERMTDEIRGTVKRDIGGDRQDIDRMDTSYDRLTFKHLLLPIWLLTVIFQEQPFQVMINGVTGEVHGQRPWSVIKIAAAVVAAVIVLAVAFVVWKSTSGGT